MGTWGALSFLHCTQCQATCTPIRPRDGPRFHCCLVQQPSRVSLGALAGVDNTPSQSKSQRQRLRGRGVKHPVGNPHGLETWRRIMSEELRHTFRVWVWARGDHLQRRRESCRPRQGLMASAADVPEELSLNTTVESVDSLYRIGLTAAYGRVPAAKG